MPTRRLLPHERLGDGDGDEEVVGVDDGNDSPLRRPRSASRLAPRTKNRSGGDSVSQKMPRNNPNFFRSRVNL